jgi:sterol desaturase/sphingolipid hydroxylase (fatty acid hydroxylase superfamily)
MNVACPSTWPLMWGLLMLLILFAIIVLKHIDIYRMLKYKECFKYIKPNEKIKKLNRIASFIHKVSRVLLPISGLSIWVLYVIYLCRLAVFQLIVQKIGYQTIALIMLVLLTVFMFDLFIITIMPLILIFIDYFKEDVVFCDNITLWSYLKILVLRYIHGNRKNAWTVQ